MLANILVKYFEAGGPIMWPILITAIVAVAVVGERTFWWWRESLKRDPATLEKLFAASENGDFRGASRLSKDSDSREAPRKSPFSMAAKSFSSVAGSRLRLSRHHQKVRSPTTATATIAVMRIGHIIGPPASKYLTRMFASIAIPLEMVV